MRKKHIGRRKIGLLKHELIRNLYEEKAIELVGICIPNFQDILRHGFM